MQFDWLSSIWVYSPLAKKENGGQFCSAGDERSFDFVDKQSYCSGISGKVNKMKSNSVHTGKFL